MSWRQLLSRFQARRVQSPLLRGWLTGWLGNAGERHAARFLRKLGYQIVARGYKTALGELDLVARDGSCVVFVEVKTRRSDDAGLPFEAVDARKQRQLTKLALAFLKRRGWLDQPARFDVISIVWSDTARPPEITHFRNAFEAAGHGQMFS